MESNYDLLEMDSIEDFKLYYKAQIKKNCSGTENVKACWEWALSRNSGYGKMTYTYYLKEHNGIKSHQKSAYSHRLMYAVTNDRLDLLCLYEKEEQVSHLCQTRPWCCNPAHLTLEHEELNKDRIKCKTTYAQCPHQPQCIFSTT